VSRVVDDGTLVTRRLHYGCPVGVVSFIDYDSKEACSASTAAKLIKKYFMKCPTAGRQLLIYDRIWRCRSLQLAEIDGPACLNYYRKV